MVVMHQAVRRMVKTAQKFARRTAAAVKMQVIRKKCPSLSAPPTLEEHALCFITQCMRTMLMLACTPYGCFGEDNMWSIQLKQVGFSQACMLQWPS